MSLNYTKEKIAEKFYKVKTTINGVEHTFNCVVANDTKPSRAAVGLNYSSESRLRIVRHRVSLVKNHNLKLRDVATIWMP